MLELKSREANFFERVISGGGPETLAQCFRCGACSGICPVEKVAEDFDPRKIVHAVLLGLREELLSGESIWKCSGCGSCVPVCPMDVKFMEVI